MSINTGTDISNLSPNTTYTFKVYPLNQNDAYDINTYSNVQFTTLPKINSLSLNSVVSSSQINVNIVGGAFNTVQPKYSTDNISYTNFGSTLNSGTSLVQYTGLSANTRYYFQMIPYNSQSVTGTTVSLVDANCVTLGVVSNFVQTDSTQTSVTLSWNGIYENANIINTTTSTTTSLSSSTSNTTQTITISSLISGSSYAFTFNPYNSIGILGQTANLTASTLSSVTCEGGTTVDLTNYILYVFTNTTGNKRLSNCSLLSGTSIYVLCVGGGGGSGYLRGGGGGGGAVCQAKITFTQNLSDNISIVVGEGGSGGTSTSTDATNGGYSSVTFDNATNNTSYRIISPGGGKGGKYGNKGGKGGSSGGDGSEITNNTKTDASGVTIGNNVTLLNTTTGYSGGYGSPNNGGGCGGGGADSVGLSGYSQNNGKIQAFGGNGGNGVTINSSLLGIYGSVYSVVNSTNIYYGGGGGGGAEYGNGGNGGNGGGGGGATWSYTYNSISYTAGSGGNGLNNGSAGQTTDYNTNAVGGSGGINTGGGGGGGATNSNGGSGGSGIVIIAIPK